MPKYRYTLPLIAALGLGAPAFAQETTAAETAAEAAATAVENAAEEATTTATEAVENAAEQAADAVSEAATAVTEGATTESTAEAEAAAPVEAEAATTEAASEEQPAAADAPASGEAAPEGDANSDLAMGEEVKEDPTYIKEEHGDWQLKCFRTESGNDPCQMFQLLKEEAGNPIAEFSIFRLPAGQQAIAGATVVVPLGTLLSSELKISVDGGKAKSYPFRFCNLVGCYVQLGLTKADVDAFKRGAKATLTIVPAQAPDQKVGIPASLTGFTAAFDAASVLEQ